MKKLLFLLPFLLLAGCGVQDECKEMVKDYLNAPSTAKFSKMETYKTEYLGNVVGGLVESQNKLGATVWDRFYCIIWDEKLVVFDDWDTRDIYESVKNIVKDNPRKSDSSGSDKDRKICEDATRKALKDDSIKISKYEWDEDEDYNLRLNLVMFEYKWEIKWAFCYVKDDKVYQIKIDDKIYKVTQQ